MKVWKTIEVSDRLAREVDDPFFLLEGTSALEHVDCCLSYIYDPLYNTTRFYWAENHD